jgi:hypothetical protein
MKKLFYALMIVIGASLTITACTEEEVAPTSEMDNGGGGAVDPKN